MTLNRRIFQFGISKRKCHLKMSLKSNPFTIYTVSRQNHSKYNKSYFRIPALKCCYDAVIENWHFSSLFNCLKCSCPVKMFSLLLDDFHHLTYPFPLEWLSSLFHHCCSIYLTVWLPDNQCLGTRQLLPVSTHPMELQYQDPTPSELKEVWLWSIFISTFQQALSRFIFYQ